MIGCHLPVMRCVASPRRCGLCRLSCTAFEPDGPSCDENNKSTNAFLAGGGHPSEHASSGDLVTEPRDGFPTSAEFVSGTRTLRGPSVPLGIVPKQLRFSHPSRHRIGQSNRAWRPPAPELHRRIASPHSQRLSQVHLCQTFSQLHTSSMQTAANRADADRQDLGDLLVLQFLQLPQLQNVAVLVR